MKSRNETTSDASAVLPESLRPLFWDCSFSELDWEDHRDFLIARILTVGDWNTVRWLWSHLGDAALRDWIVRREGGTLTPQQLRFWQLILDLPSDQVDRWLAQTARKIWNDRLHR